MMKSNKIRSLLLPCIVICTAFAIGLCNVYYTAGDSGKSRSTVSVLGVSVENPEVDAGEYLIGSRLSHVFTLTNNGLAQVNLDKVTTNCSCVDVKLSDRTIFPDQTVTLTLSRLVDDLGNINTASAVVSLSSLNPADKDVLSVKVSARVAAPPLATYPGKLNLGQVKIGQTIQRKVFLHSRELQLKTFADPFQIVAGEASILALGDLSKLEAPPASQGSLLINFQIPKNHPKGSYTNEIKIFDQKHQGIPLAQINYHYTV